MATLRFLGANQQVTGSRYAVTVGDTTVLVDCGMFQEREFLERNWQPSLIPVSGIDAMILTHAHLDHCGLIPRMVKDGFSGPIYCTRPTADLTELILRDSADIQVEDAKYKRKRHRREGRQAPHPELPLYDELDVDRTLPLLRPVPYSRSVPIGKQIKVTFHDAGHILGSAFLEVKIVENGQPIRLVFSGDLGQGGKPLLRDPTRITTADYLVLESTYGDREHTDKGPIESQLAEAIAPSLRDGGKVVIPTFAVERAQELMYHLSRLVHENRIPNVGIYLDSPMAIDATALFQKHGDALDAETWNLINSGEAPLRFPGLTMVRTTDQSKALNQMRGPAIIMATSGMCTGGRIKHHLAQTLGDSRNTVLFCGYQAAGTLGRQILEGQTAVRIHGRSCDVRARVRQLFGLSGHADRAGLLQWLTPLQTPPRQTFLTHGEKKAAESLAKTIQTTLGWSVQVPAYGEEVELAAR